MFLFKKRDSERQKTIERLYGAIVAQARNADFYARLGAPDTVEGRFDLLVLHVHLVKDRLAAAGDTGKALAQALLDRFFEDMDASLREIGIGDLSVPRKMRSLAEAFLGRSAAYQAALSANDEAALSGALARNLLGNADAEAARPFAIYAAEAAAKLAVLSDAAMLAGEVEFPAPSRADAHA